MSCAAGRAVGLRIAAVEDLARRRREDQAAHASTLQAASAGFSPSAAEAEVRCAALEAKLAESEDSRRESEEALHELGELELSPREVAVRLAGHDRLEAELEELRLWRADQDVGVVR